MCQGRRADIVVFIVNSGLVQALDKNMTIQPLVEIQQDKDKQLVSDAFILPVCTPREAAFATSLVRPFKVFCFQIDEVLLDQNLENPQRASFLIFLVLNEHHE